MGGSDGVHCRWEGVEPEITGDCVGNDSRCLGATRSRCETLAINSACTWKARCKSWCHQSIKSWGTKCGWKNCLGCSQCIMASGAMLEASSTMTSSTTVSSTTTVTTTTTPMHCFGTDSRCEGAEEEQCLKLSSNGVHCDWEPMVPETTGECVGNDSRCLGAPRSRCEKLARNSNCVWKRKCKGWCGDKKNELVGWKKKCMWESCQGCHQCHARQLQGMWAEQASSDLLLV